MRAGEAPDRKARLGVLLLHALPLDARMWAAQMGLLGANTYAPDLYPLGDSVEAWAQAVLNTVPCETFIIVGCSVGGSCALEIARRAPERVAALVLVGTKARHDPDPVARDALLACLKDEGVEAAWDADWARLFAKGSDRETQARAKSIALGHSACDLVRGVTAFHTRPSAEDVVAACQHPVHVVTGAHDTLPGRAYCEALVKIAPHGSLHIIASSGHYPSMSNPAAFNAVLEKVIEAHL